MATISTASHSATRPAYSAAASMLREKRYPTMMCAVTWRPEPRIEYGAKAAYRMFELPATNGERARTRPTKRPISTVLPPCLSK